MKPDKKYVRSLIQSSLLEAGITELKEDFVEVMTNYIMDNNVEDRRSFSVWKRPVVEYLGELKAYWEYAAKLVENDPDSREAMLRAYDLLYIQVRALEDGPVS